MKQPCKNHPDKLTGRKCYRCKEYICSDCIYSAFHHYFCGRRCIVLFAIPSAFKKVFPAKLFLVPIKRIYRASIIFNRAVFISVFIIFVVSLMYLYNRIAALSDQLTAIQNTIITLTEKASEPLNYEGNPKPVGLPAIDSLSSSDVYTNTLSITGSGGKDLALLLSINGEFADAIILPGGKFRFNNVHLRPGKNILSFTTVSPENETHSVGVITVTYHIIPYETLVQSLQRGDMTVPEIALTFDGGSTANNALPILKVLKEKQVAATFFLTGAFMKRYPDIVRQIIADGHSVGNHTFSHPHLTTYEENRQQNTRPAVTKAFFQQELLKTDSLFFAITGVHLKPFWRAPYGEQNRELREWAAELGYRHILWTIGKIPGENMDTRDWVSDESSELYKSAQEIRDAVLNFGIQDPGGYGANGSIVLMHLGTNRKEDFLYQVLPEIIDGFRQRGYTFCTVSELLEIPDSPEGRIFVFALK